MSPVSDHPLTSLLKDWLPACDFAVMQHGLTPYGRDYFFEIEVASVATKPGRYELLFTHVTDITYETRVGDDVWPRSWDDIFIDYQTWETNGEPEGYVWGSNWSLAYPGISIIGESDAAQKRTKNLGKPFFAAKIATDRFSLTLVFHAVRHRKLSEKPSLVDQVIFPLK